MKKKLKILFWGNSGNYPFELAEMLSKDHFVEMFHMQSDWIWNKDSYSIDENNFPSWNKIYDDSSYFRSIFIERKILNYINNNFDVVVVCGNSLISAFAFKIPYVIFPTGGEINSNPFLTFRSFINLKTFFRAFYLNLSIKRAQKILSTADGFPFHIKAYSRFKHKGVVNCYAPINQDYLKSLVKKDLLLDLNNKYKNFNLVILWFNRFNSVPNTPSFKDPQLFLDSIFITLEKHKNIKIIYAEHGVDFKKFHKKIKDSKFSSSFECIPYLKGGEYHTYLSIENAIVVDSLASSNGGYNSHAIRDSLGLNALVAANYDNDIYYVYPQGYPIFRVNSANDLVKVFSDLYHWTKNDRDEYKKKIQKWFDEYMDHKIIIKNYEKELLYLLLFHKYKTKIPYPFSLIGTNKL